MPALMLYVPWENDSDFSENNIQLNSWNKICQVAVDVIILFSKLSIQLSAISLSKNLCKLLLPISNIFL